MRSISEMAAFAKFGSDLDKATQALLASGSRLTELLKQGQYVPIPVEKQVVLLYAGANGYIDNYPESALKKYEQEMIKFIETKHADVLKDIEAKKGDRCMRSRKSFTRRSMNSREDLPTKGAFRWRR